MRISLTRACDMLRTRDNFLIIPHKAPDGDAIGCAIALWYGLKALGKRAMIRCNDPFPARYSYMTGGYKDDNFTPQCVVSVDTADRALIGNALAPEVPVDLSIDHHPSNTGFAQHTLLDAKSAAACEVIYRVLHTLGVDITPEIASALYTGISTDTGCFRHSNTTVRSLTYAARMIKAGADHAMINKVMFATKTRRRILLEQQALSTLEFYHNDRCALIALTTAQLEQAGVEDESELDGISNIPIQIEGVEVGVTIRQRGPAEYKISMRTGENVDASQVCQTFGGGGHARAAGCTIEGTLPQVKERVVEVLAPLLQE